MEVVAYLNDGTTVVWWPVKNFKGCQPRSDTTLEMYFTPVNQRGQAPGRDNDVIVLTLSSNNKHKEVIQDITEAFCFPEKSVVTIFDSDESVKISSHISSYSLTMSQDP
jgi:glycerol kinase